MENRRPIKARGASWAKQLAASIARTGVTPNQISVLSAIFALGSFFFYLNPAQTLSFSGSVILGALFIQLRLICNLLDGMVAVEHAKKTKSGELFNDAPDRFADLFIIIGVGYAMGFYDFAIELGYLGAALAIMTAYVRVLGASMGTVHFFMGPMAKQHRMAIITIASIIDAIWYSQSEHFGALYVALWILVVGSAITVLRRLIKVKTALETN